MINKLESTINQSFIDIILNVKWLGFAQLHLRCIKIKNNMFLNNQISLYQNKKIFTVNFVKNYIKMMKLLINI